MSECVCVCLFVCECELMLVFVCECELVVVFVCECVGVRLLCAQRYLFTHRFNEEASFVHEKQ